MRKVFVFWLFVLIILIIGISAIVYGKRLLKKEREATREIQRELALPKVHKAPEISEVPLLPAAPLAVKIEEPPAEIEIPEPMPPLDVESLKAPEGLELPEVPEGEIISPISPPDIPEMPALPELP